MSDGFYIPQALLQQISRRAAAGPMTTPQPQAMGLNAVKAPSMMLLRAPDAQQVSPSIGRLAPNVAINPYDITGRANVVQPQRAAYTPPNTLSVDGRAAYEQPSDDSQPMMGLQSHTPSPEMMRLLQPTPEEQAYQSLLTNGPSHHSGGIGSRIKDVLKGMALGAASSDPNERWMGLLGGGIASGVNPQAAHNLEWKQQVPVAGQRAAASRAIADGEFKRRMELADATGMMDGQPTMKLLNAQAMNNYRLGNQNLRQQTIDNTKDWHQRLIQEKKDDRAQKYGHYSTEDLIKMWSGGGMNGKPDMLRHLADRLQLPDEIDDKFLPGMIQTVVGGNGNFTNINKQTGDSTDTGVQSGAFNQKAQEIKLRGQGLHIQAANSMLRAYQQGAAMTPEARATLKAAGVANADSLPDTYDPGKVLYNQSTGEITVVGANSGTQKGGTKVTPSPGRRGHRSYGGGDTGGNQTTGTQRTPQQQAAVDEYKKRVTAKPEKAAAIREAFKQQMGFDPEQ